jgi:hypothetical protein
LWRDQPEKSGTSSLSFRVFPCSLLLISLRSILLIPLLLFLRADPHRPDSFVLWSRLDSGFLSFSSFGDLQSSTNAVMPTLDVSELNIVIAVLGPFMFIVAVLFCADNPGRRFRCLLWIPFGEDQAGVVPWRSLYVPAPGI